MSANSQHDRPERRSLASGEAISLRFWEEPPGTAGPSMQCEYETVGYALGGRAELHVDGRIVRLEPGISWVVPKGTRYFYRILEHFTAVKATAAPAAPTRGKEV